VQEVIYFILVPMVYIAVAVFFVGIAIRLFKILTAPKQPTTLQIFYGKSPKWLWALRDTFFFPSVLKHKPLLWVFLMLFHAMFLLLIIGHLELIQEFKIFQVIQHEVFLGKGVIGLILSVVLLYFLFRRLKSPVRELSVPEDYYLLILLFLTVLFGSQMDWARTWYDYGELTVAQYRDYLSSLLYLKPDLPFEVTASGHSFMLVLHILFANLFLMFFPFSQLMHSILSLPMNKFRRG